MGIKVDKIDIEPGICKFHFLCPGCETIHGLWTPEWKWNGSLTNPTFSPSILSANDLKMSEQRCHSFIEDGKIRFLDDCWHELKNQSVELPDISEFFEGGNNE